MGDDQQRHQQTVREPSHASDRHLAVAQLELALQRNPEQAEEWYRLGELYDALAGDATEPEAARTYREKAVAALSQAIALSAGMAKAHYALANVYRAQDMRLALVEFEAAADHDPQQYGEALAYARQVVRACTYRLGALNLIILESAREKPRAEILEAEFYFEDRPIASAALHTCASEDGRQFARFWLFESANPDRATDRPVAEVATTSTGNVFLSQGCPSNYEPIETPAISSGGRPAPTLFASREPAAQQASVIASTAAPVPARKSRSLVWIALASTAAVGGGLFAYHTLFAPAPNPPERAAVSSERQLPPAIQASTEPLPEIVALMPESGPSPRADNPFPVSPQPSSLPAEPPASPQAGEPAASEPQYSALAPEPRASVQADKPASIPRQSRSPARPLAARAIKARPVQAPRVREQAIARRAGKKSAPVAVDAAVGRAATEAPTAETKLSLNEQLATAPPAQKEQAATEPSISKRFAAENTWVKRVRAELTSCGKPGLWRADLCRESVRWNYCHPNHWGTVRECAVGLFASSGVSD